MNDDDNDNGCYKVYIIVINVMALNRQSGNEIDCYHEQKNCISSEIDTQLTYLY